MSAEPHHPDTGSDPLPTREGLSAGPDGVAPDVAPDVAADLEEDRRRLQELDEGELGGEA